MVHEINQYEDEPCCSSSLQVEQHAAEGEDWYPPNSDAKKYPDTFTITLEKKEWIKRIVPAADRIGIAAINVCYINLSKQINFNFYKLAVTATLTSI